MKLFVWNCLQEDACEWTRHCFPWQTTKVHRHSKASIGIFDIPNARFHHVHTDMVSPLSPSGGHLTCVIRFTRWCEAIPLADSHTKTIILQNRISQFGALESVTTDGVPQPPCLSNAPSFLDPYCGFFSCHFLRLTKKAEASSGPMNARQHSRTSKRSSPVQPS